MRAIDTNVIVRYLTDDDADQSRRARVLIGGGDLFVSVTVILETEWVLRGAYRFQPEAIIGALRAFVGLTGISVEDQDWLTVALDSAEAGMDLADALHLARSSGCDAFVSFDRKLATVAAGRSAVPVVEP